VIERIPDCVPPYLAWQGSRSILFMRLVALATYPGIAFGCGKPSHAGLALALCVILLGFFLFGNIAAYGWSVVGQFDP
jgi:hypothetical protein